MVSSTLKSCNGPVRTFDTAHGLMGSRNVRKVAAISTAPHRLIAFNLTSFIL